MMWGIDPSVILILIPIVVVGIVAVAAIGSRDEVTRGDRIAKFFSIASNAAIFFTVLALLYQVIDSEEQAKRASYSEILDTYYEINQMQIENPGAWRVIFPAEEVYATMSEDEQLALQFTYFIMNFFERVYLMYLDGAVDDQQWPGWESWIRYALLTSPLFQQEWDDGCGMYHPDFVAYIEANFDDGMCGSPGDQASDAAGTPAAAAN